MRKTLAVFAAGLVLLLLFGMPALGVALGRQQQATPPGGCFGAGSYVNPFHVGMWAPARTDQGVDWLPIVPSPVVAIGDGVVTYSATSGTGWPGGAFLTYQLTDGPAAGQYIYVAEHLTNLVPVKTVLTPGQQIATALPGDPWTEWGWAAPTGPEPAIRYNGAADGTPTEGGNAFARFLKSLGANPLQDPGPGPLLVDGPTAPAAGTAPPTACANGLTTPTEFANAVLAALQIPANNSNVPAFVAWEMAEGGWKINNPLNTTLPMAGATDLVGNPAHVKLYPSIQVGLDATASVLSEPAYTLVVAALRGSDPLAVVRAVLASPWGTTQDFTSLIGKPYTG